jgi:hypothetical protein
MHSFHRGRGPTILLGYVSYPAQENLPPLTLVLRDGQVLEAAAFTITNDQVTYVTAEGIGVPSRFGNSTNTQRARRMKNKVP